MACQAFSTSLVTGFSDLEDAHVSFAMNLGNNCAIMGTFAGLSGVSGAGSDIKAALTKISDGVSSIISTIRGFVGSITDAGLTMLASIVQTANNMYTAVNAAIDKMVTGIQSMMTAVKAVTCVGAAASLAKLPTSTIAAMIANPSTAGSGHAMSAAKSLMSGLGPTAPMTPAIIKGLQSDVFGRIGGAAQLSVISSSSGSAVNFAAQVNNIGAFRC
jgi:hypothetical protein